MDRLVPVNGSGSNMPVPLNTWVRPVDPSTNPDHKERYQRENNVRFSLSDTLSNTTRELGRMSDSKTYKYELVSSDDEEDDEHLNSLRGSLTARDPLTARAKDLNLTPETYGAVQNVYVSNDDVRELQRKNRLQLSDQKNKDQTPCRERTPSQTTNKLNPDLVKWFNEQNPQKQKMILKALNNVGIKINNDHPD
jgi:hypothetical protein